MRRFHVWLLLVSGCAVSPETLSVFMPDGWEPQAASGGPGGDAGSTSASGSAGGEGEGGATSTSASVGSSGGGAGGETCVPKADPCGVGCGDVDDGCGHTVQCGCADGERCSSGACCAPSTCAPGMCGIHEDGCGGEIDCGGTCGDGTMFCDAGTCQCADVSTIPYGDAAETGCQRAGLGHARACGEISDDVPAGCRFMSATIGVGGPLYWCCQ